MALDNRRQTTNNQPANGDLTTDILRLQNVLREARMQLIGASVENLDNCQCQVSDAADQLRQLQMAIGREKKKRAAGLSAPLRDLRAEITYIAILLDSAAAFHTGWVRLARSLSSGYSAGGTPVHPEAARRVALEM